MEREPAAGVHQGCLITHHSREGSQGVSWAVGAVGDSSQLTGVQSTEKGPGDSGSNSLGHSA